MGAVRGNRWRHGAVLIGVGALVAGVVGGCGGGTTTTPATSAPAASTGTATSSLTGLTGDQVLARARTAAQAAKSVRVKGDISQQGQTITIDLSLSGVARGTAAIDQDGGHIDLVRIGNDVYFKADEKTLTRTVAQGNAQIVKLIAGRYVKAAITSPGFRDFAGLLNLVEFVKGVMSPDGTVRRVAGKPVGGVPTVGLKDEAKDGGFLYISDRGTPYPLRLEPSAGAGGITMSDWDADVTINAPAAADVIDVSALK